MKIASLVAIAGALRDADVRYLIVGGLAVAAHGYGRVTFDFVTEPFDFDQEYETALIGELAPNLSTRFVGLDALIRMKEATGRDKDREDVRQLRLLQRDDAHECCGLGGAQSVAAALFPLVEPARQAGSCGKHGRRHPAFP